MIVDGHYRRATLRALSLAKPSRPGGPRRRLTPVTAPSVHFKSTITVTLMAPLSPQRSRRESSAPAPLRLSAAGRLTASERSLPFLRRAFYRHFDAGSVPSPLITRRHNSLDWLIVIKIQRKVESNTASVRGISCGGATLDQKRTGWNEHIIDNAIALVAWPLTTCAAIPAAGEVGTSQKVILNSEDTDTHANVTGVTRSRGSHLRRSCPILPEVLFPASTSARITSEEFSPGPHIAVSFATIERSDRYPMRPSAVNRS
jgi:hypothetical protein